MQKYTKLRLFAIVSLILLTIVVLALFLVNGFISKKVLVALKERVSAGSHGEYVLTVDDLYVNIFSRSVNLENIVIAPVRKNISKYKAGYVLKANSLKIVGFSLLSYFKTKDLRISSIQFNDPHIAIYQKQHRGIKPKEVVLEDFSLFEIISPSLRTLVIDEIDIENSHFSIYKGSEDTTALLSSADNSISIRNFVISEESEGRDNLFTADKFEIVMNRFSYHLPGNMYTLSGKKLYTSYTDSIIRIDSFQLVPAYPKKEFGKMAGRQTTRAAITSSVIKFGHIDVKRFLEQNSFIARNLTLEGFYIDAYRDNNIPLEQVERPSVQAIVRTIPFEIAIDSILLVNASAVYEDLAQGAQVTGIMSLEKINGTITGFHNDTASYNENSKITASLDALFMKQGAFRAQYVFPLNTREEKCFCKGSMAAMPIKIIEPLTAPTKGVYIKSGQLDSMTFSFSTDGRRSDGRMSMAYRDLTVNVNPDNKDDKTFRAKLTTAIANKIILINSNPGRNGEFRTVNMGVEKNLYRYFPYFFMQSLLSGITASVQGEKKSKFLKRTRLFEKK
ncbi:MAG TPA: DUF748 domain-containing protein [Bacteroidia bacterium]|jgi:hypothetical protein